MYVAEHTNKYMILISQARQKEQTKNNNNKTQREKI